MSERPDRILPGEEPFLKAIAEDPNNDTLRRLHADWLEEHGDPRGPVLVQEFSASEILNPKYVHGILDVERHFGVQYSREQLQRLADMPFSRQTLEECKDTHVLVAGFPLSLNEIRGLAADFFRDTDWCRDEPFANDTKVDVRWHLLRKEAVPRSRRKAYDAQAALLTKEEEVPFVCEVTYMAILHWLTHRERLLSELCVRCQDKDSNGSRIYVGSFHSDRFYVDSYWDDTRLDYLGLASSRKS